MLAALPGRRIGEARGRSWRRVHAEHLEVREAADAFNDSGAEETEAATRTVPIGPYLAAIVANWKAAGEGKEGLVLPSEEKPPLGYAISPPAT